MELDQLATLLYPGLKNPDNEILTLSSVAIATILIIGTSFYVGSAIEIPTTLYRLPAEVVDLQRYERRALRVLSHAGRCNKRKTFVRDQRYGAKILARKYQTAPGSATSEDRRSTQTKELPVNRILL